MDNLPGLMYPPGGAQLVVAKTDPVTGGIELSVGNKKVEIDPLDPTAWPMIVPVVMASPPTYTDGVGGAASVLTTGQDHSIFDPSKFTILGGPAPRGVNYPRYMGSLLGSYPQNTTSAPVSVEFALDTADSTGRFEIDSIGLGGKMRLLVRQPAGEWASVTQYNTRVFDSSGARFRDLVTLGAAGGYTIRIETSNCLLIGVRTGVSDTVTATNNRRRRYIVVGDSFSEPTISDAGSFTSHQGWVQQLAYLTGLDLWSSARGSTGYSATGAYVKFSDRLQQDVLDFDPDGVIFAGGINDSATDISAFESDVRECFAAVSGRELLVLSPFWPKGYTGIPNTFWQYRDVVKSVCADYGGTFLDLLSYGGQANFLSGESGFSAVLSSAYASGNSIVVSDIPAYFKSATPGVNKWFVKVGSGNNQVIREVVNITGTGPYTLSVNALGSAFAVGSLVRLTAQPYMTGTGKQGATVGDGNADRYTGPDGTHPSAAGHAHIARCVADLWSRSLAGR